LAASSREAAPVMPLLQMRQSAELALQRLQHALDVRLGFHVPLDRDRVAARCPNRTDNRVSRTPVANIIDAHLESAGTRELGASRADAPAAAGDEENGLLRHGWSFG
jgi:hypothetical protein